MKALLLSLGHGSSAVLLDNGHVMCGYENERLTKVKSDSRFPREAIEEIASNYDISGCDIYISHWFIDGELPRVPNKYYDTEYMRVKFPLSRIYHTNIDFTHHDAHAYSVLAFSQQTIYQEDSICIVADGFGTMGECVSIYNVSKTGGLGLHHRSFGFSSSLGLLYQYATSYLGLKENQDEYKLLGYEANIEAVAGQLNIDIDLLRKIAMTDSEKQLKDIGSYDVKDRYDPLCSIDALPALKLLYRSQFDAVVKVLCGTTDIDIDHKRVIISYYVQFRLEIAMSMLISAYRPRNVYLAGGVFMNVKLNNMIIEMVPGKTCIMPLCGDQGAPIGLYHYLNDDFMWPGHLYWGRRKLNVDESVNSQLTDAGIIVCTADQASQILEEALNKDMIVNLVRGGMEFGARSLCNTSTLALPTAKNVIYINTLNSRSTVMPMAPVVHEKYMGKYFVDSYKRIAKSLEYMICAVNYRLLTDKHLGAAHPVPYTTYWSGRPQLVREESDPFMTRILEKFDGILINTSFNVHGQPIVYNLLDVYNNHVYQKNNDTEQRLLTIVIGK